MEQVFLDHNAGCRVRPEIVEFVAGLLGERLGNPSSLHREGRVARDVIERARDCVARLVGARPGEVVFTSGGTEANNLAILGACLEAECAGIVVAPTEHASVLRAVERVQRAGVPVRELVVDGAGRISAESLEAAVAGLKEARVKRLFASVAWANGELGTLQPMAQLTETARRAAAGMPVYLHSDGVQAAVVEELNLDQAGLNAVTLSGHKLGALPGVGALVVSRSSERGWPLHKQSFGGNQEREQRAGTENIVGIASFGRAAELALEERRALTQRLAAWREELWARLASAAAPVVRLTPKESIPTTLNVSFPDLRGDALVIAADLAGLSIATGSACAAGAAEPSHVLRAIGCSMDVARGALRLSMGATSTRDEVGRGAEILVSTVRSARERLGRGSRTAARGVPIEATLAEDRRHGL